MKHTLELRGHIRSESNILSYVWHKKGTRFFPKSLVSNAESILRFLALGYKPNIILSDDIIRTIGKSRIEQKSYPLKVFIDPDQHFFLYRTLENIKEDGARFYELLRIHDLWVLYFGLIVYEGHPLEKLIENAMKSRDDNDHGDMSQMSSFLDGGKSLQYENLGLLEIKRESATNDHATLADTNDQAYEKPMPPQDTQPDLHPSTLESKTNTVKKTGNVDSKMKQPDVSKSTKKTGAGALGNIVKN